MTLTDILKDAVGALGDELSDRARDTWHELAESFADDPDQSRTLHATVGAWIPAFVATKNLIGTLGRLGTRLTRDAVDENEPILTDDIREELGERLGELRDSSPDAADLFFGADDFDSLIERIQENDRERQLVEDFVESLQVRIDDFVARLVQWILEPDEQELEPARTARFLRRLEALLDEVLHKWVVPSAVEE